MTTMGVHELEEEIDVRELEMLHGLPRPTLPQPGDCTTLPEPWWYDEQAPFDPFRPDEVAGDLPTSADSVPFGVPVLPGSQTAEVTANVTASTTTDDPVILQPVPSDDADSVVSISRAERRRRARMTKKSA